MMPPKAIMLAKDEGESSGDLASQDSMSVGSTMAKGAALMKEEDADFLARGVRDSCSSGATPVFAPINPPSSKTFPLIPPAVADGQMGSYQESEMRGARVEGGEFTRMAQNFSHGSHLGVQQTQGTADQANAVTSGLHNDECDSISGLERLQYKRCLSGDVVLPRTALLELVDTTSTAQEETKSPSPISVAAEVRPSNPNDATEEAKSSEFMSRSKSYDRRLHEAAQFAEAVGEMPPLHQSEVQVIIEELESDYDDSDSEGEIVIDASSVAPDEGSVVSLRRSSSVGNDQQTPDAQPGDSGLSDTSVHRRQKSRPRWPFTTSKSSDTFLHKLPPPGTQSYVYKGICSNPPEITKRGISRGNYAQLHRKAWLEVSDKYHRYGKNLRLYYKKWENLGYPTNQFFDWLDSKGEAAGQPLPVLEECPRSQLDSDTVHYMTNPDVTDGYALSIQTIEDGRALVLDVDGDPVQTGTEGWIFVLRDHTLYGAEKITSVSGHSRQRFHHSSFFSGKAVAAAGILITDEDGFLSRLYPHSGHYRPGEADMQRMLFHLHDKGVNLRTLEMDTQQMLRVSRTEPQPSQHPGPEKKKKKIQSLHLKSAVYVACFLAHKARFIGEGIFDQIHTIRKAHVTSVAEALDECDDGGFWAKVRREFSENRKVQ